MKYSNYIGVIAALGVIGSCFAPWVSIQSINVIITGFHTTGTNFGYPGLLNVIMCVISIACFLLPYIGAKRLNLFTSSFNLAWAFRNFLIISQCEQGDCPEKKWGIYAIVILSVIMLLMSLFPKVEMK